MVSFYLNWALVFDGGNATPQELRRYAYHEEKILVVVGHISSLL